VICIPLKLSLGVDEISLGISSAMQNHKLNTLVIFYFQI
jgi:hypothetical protein